MMAKFLLHLPSKFEFARDDTRTCGSVEVRVDVCFVTALQNWRRKPRATLYKLGEGAAGKLKKN
jgi:hypothetical protein